MSSKHSRNARGCETHSERALAAAKKNETNPIAKMAASFFDQSGVEISDKKNEAAKKTKRSHFAKMAARFP
jgi:hypothetical protein